MEFTNCNGVSGAGSLFGSCRQTRERTLQVSSENLRNDLTILRKISQGVEPRSSCREMMGDNRDRQGRSSFAMAVIGSGWLNGRSYAATWLKCPWSGHHVWNAWKFILASSCPQLSRAGEAPAVGSSVSSVPHSPAKTTQQTAHTSTYVVVAQPNMCVIGPPQIEQWAAFGPKANLNRVTTLRWTQAPGVGSRMSTCG